MRDYMYSEEKRQIQ